MEVVYSFVENLNFGNISNVLAVPAQLARFSLNSQSLIGLLVLIIVILWGFSLGRTRALVSLLGIYIAFVVEEAFPYLDSIYYYVGDFPEYWMKSAIFLGMYIIVFLILNHSFIKKRFTSAEFSVFGVFFISILQIGLLLSIFASFLTPELATSLLGNFEVFFASDAALFWWAVLPIPMLLFMKEGK